MKRCLLAIFLGLFSMAAFANTSLFDFSQDFQGKSACFILFNLNQDKLVTKYNPSRCEERIDNGKTSGNEQLNFLKTSMTDKLKDNMYLETSSNGWKLYGETGGNNSQQNTHHNLEEGWFIGFIQKDEQKYIFVLNFSDLQTPNTTENAGDRAKQIIKTILARLNLF